MQSKYLQSMKKEETTRGKSPVKHLMDIEEIKSKGYTFSQAENSLRETGSVRDAINYLQSMKKEETTKGKTPVHSPLIAPMVQKTVNPIHPKVIDEKEAPVDSLLAETTTALRKEEEANTPALPLLALRDSRLPRHGEQESFSTLLLPDTALNSKEDMQKDYLVGSLAKSESLATKKTPMPHGVDANALTTKEAIAVKKEVKYESASAEDIMKEHEWVRFEDTAPFDVDTDSSKMSNSDESTVSRDDVVCDNTHDVVGTETLEPPVETQPGAFAVLGIDGIDQADDLLTVSQQTSRDPSVVSARLVDPDEENQILEQRLEEELQAQHERAPVAQVVKTGWYWRRVACVVGAVLILLAVTLGVTLKLTLSASDETPSPDPPPADIVELLSPVSFDNGSSLMDHETPQFAAAWWLAGNAHLKNYTDEQKIQRYSLATLYHSTNGLKWTVNKHWMSDLDECRWFGKLEGENMSEPIECVNNRTIKRLILNENNLDGTIPDEVALLHDSLVELILGENRLRGDVPTTVGMLTKMTHLNLRKNMLSGSVPTTLGLLTRLQEGRLYDNKLKGNIPTEIGRLENLTYFRISENDLVGPLPETALGRLTSMESLYFFENRLTGHIPTSLALLRELRTLRLQENSFTGQIPSALGLLSKLTDLNFYHNKLNGTVPTSIGQLVALESMFLDKNSLSGTIPTEIALLSAPEELDIHVNNFTGPISTIP